MDRRVAWLGISGVCGLLALLVGGIVVIPRLLYPPLSPTDLRGVSDARERIELQQTQSRLANDARSALLQGLAGLVVIVGAVTTWRQVHINREGQITDRITRAVDQLGSENAHVRIGGIYALERIAKNSAADRDTIQWLLGAFVRSHAPWPVGDPDGPEHPTRTVDEHLPWMRVRAPDIQAAMGVLGRRLPSRDEQIIYFSRVDLRSLALRGARLSGAKFRYANLARAVLIGVQLDRSDLTRADLRQTHLERARLINANLIGAYLQGSNLRGADLSHADLRGANLSEAILEQTVLAGARADVTTIWPAEMDAERRHDLGVIDVDRDEPDLAKTR